MLPLTHHARFEMERRGISDREVESVFKKPEQKIAMASGREIWQNKVLSGHKEYIVRLVVEKTPRMKIITVYRTSKIDKYWRTS